MRGIGPIVSIGGHAIILFWGLISFAPEPLESDFVEALPVEFVTIADVTDLTKGVKTAKKVIDSEETVEKPDIVSKAISKAPGPAEKPVETPDPVPVPVPDVAKKPVEARPPEPTPEPAPPEPKPEEAAKPEPPAPKAEPKPVEAAKPEPAKPEPPKPVEVARAPDLLADLIEKTPEKTPEKAPEKPVEPKPVEKKAEAKAEPEPVEQKTEAPPPATPAPRLNPRPKVKTAAVAPELLDKRKPATNTGGQPEKAASLGTSTGSVGAKLTQTELDGLRDAIQRCWSLPPGYSAGRDFQAKVRTRLSKDGRVEGRIDVVSVTGFDGGPPILIRNAVKVAIEKCQPYKLPSNKFAEWQNLEVTFYP